MTLSKKASLGLGLMVMTIVFIASFAYYGIHRLSNSLEYIVGPAWDSADGAMETTIELQRQIHLVELMLSGKSIDAAVQKESAQAAAEAYGRLRSARIVDSSMIAELDNELKNWQELEAALVREYQQFSNVRGEFRAVTADLVLLLEELEEQGDAAVEVLERNPNTQVSWNNGLQEKWEAADGGMETTIGLLQQLYFIERLLRGEAPDAMRQQINQAAMFMEEAMNGMLSTNAFNGVSQRAAGKTQSAALRDQVKAFSELRNQMIAAYAEYNSTNLTYQTATRNLLTLLEEVEMAGDSKVEEQANISAGTVSSVFTLMTVAFVVGLIVAAFLTVMTRRMIVSPIVAIAERIHNIATGDGDLTRRTSLVREDEIGDLSRYVDEFIERLQSMITRIKSNGVTIRELVSRTGSSTDVINGSAQKTASQADEVAVASEQMSQVSSEIASSCVRAATSSETASQLAGRGQRRVQDTITSMKSITGRVNDSSASIASLKEQADKIGEIVSVIAGISEQTNLLALNAAIEAARAGEQGRGFAVVADEVRTLAQRTADSTTEISHVIKAIQDQTNECFTLMESCVGEVATGMSRSAEAGETLEEIRVQMEDLSMMINQISAATEEQTITISEVSAKVQNIAGLAQQSNNDARQSRDFVYQLDRSSDALDGELAQFTV